MAKNNGGLTKIVSFIAWLTGVIVALAVGSSLITGILTVPYLDSIPYLMDLAGWVVVIATVLGAVLAIIDALK